MSKILIDEATVKLVLEALQEVYFGSRSAKHDEAITALREALAEQPAQQEPLDSTQISKVWWDGERLMAKPIPFVEFYKPAQQEPVAFCDPSDPNARTAFSWPGFDRQPHHTATLHTTPQPAPAPLTNEKGQPLKFWGGKAEQPAPVQPAQPERCYLCDCTGDIHSADGELRGECPYCKLPAQQEPAAHSVIAGALFDFMGWLTSRKERLVLSSADDASAAVEAITAFAKMRNLSLDDAKVQNWHTTPQPAQRTWVELEESDMPDGDDPLFDDPKFIAGMVYAENKLMEKNR